MNYFVGLVLDVTERKSAEEKLAESERRFRLMLESIPHHVWSYRSDGSVGYYNQQLVEYTGLTVEELRQGGWAALHPGDVEHGRGSRQEARSEGVAYEVEQRIRGRDGLYHRFVCRAVPVRRNGDEVIEWFGTDTDVEERRQAQEALEKAHADLAHVLRLTTMGELVASISHEINQPLAAIVNNANVCLQRLANAPLQDDVREALSDIVSDAARASAIIARIRTLTKRSTAEKAWLQINEIVTEVLALARRQLAESSITLRTDLAGDLWPVLGDRVQLQQVVLNLIMNGIEAMSALDVSNRQLTICTRRGEEAGQPVVLLSVQDSGCGFTPQESDRLFEPFYTTKAHGMGMGLRISHSIVEAHGGRLWAASVAGAGATFHCALPIESQTAYG